MPNPSGRIKVIPFSQMKMPSVCSICGRSGKDNAELFADPIVFYEWEGCQYFCQDCVLEMAALFGAGVLYSMRMELINTQTELTQTREALERAERLNDDLTRERLARRDLSFDYTGSIPINTVDQVLTDNAQEHRANVGSYAAESQSSDDSQSGVEESVNVEGPDDISEPSSDDVIEHATSVLSSIGL